MIESGEGKGGGRSPLSLWRWGVVAAVLAALAYLAGVSLANRWAIPALALLPYATEIPAPVAVAWLAPGDPTEGVLGSGVDEWQFQGQSGQSATLEMWFHPGAGSGVDAEIAVHLIGPDGATLASETGSVFLPPYLVAPDLPSVGLYRVQVVPISGDLGRYSLSLALAERIVPVTPGTVVQPTAAPLEGQIATAVQGRFEWPTIRRDISGWTFHDPANPGHIGLDIAAAMMDPIVAVADGVVVFSEWGGGYGNLVIVAHDADWVSYYAHLQVIAVEDGQAVRQGELLGGAGTTGYSTGPHLHFELRFQGRPVDPHVYLP